MDYFLALLVTCIAIGLGNCRPQRDTFFFPDEDYPFSQPDQPRQVPVPTSRLPTPTANTPATFAAGVTTARPTPTTARPTPTTGSPAYIQCLANCPTTSEYNPVCGTDRVTYNNRQRLDCANFCGPRVNQQWSAITMDRRGPCPTM